MKITIDYESSWKNSFLTGSNDEPVKKRNTKISSKNTQPPDVRDITENTVLGILCKLIGDQRKLYQSKSDDNFYFKDMKISFVQLKAEKWTEKAYLIRKTDEKGILANRPPQGSFIGVLDENEPLFFSEYAATLWAVLDFNINQLLDFILNPVVKKSNASVSPTHIINRVQFDILSIDNLQFSKDEIESIQQKIAKEFEKEKPSQSKIETYQQEIEKIVNEVNNTERGEFENKLQKCLDALAIKFKTEKYAEKNISPISLYSAALYLMIEEMNEQGLDISPLVSDEGKIKGFSKHGFNGVRDFLNPLMGNRKKTTHTPYNLTKANGQLEITLDIDTEKAKELKQMIDNAGVSSFYLGKKGLAYVSDIRLR